MGAEITASTHSNQEDGLSSEINTESDEEYDARQITAVRETAHGDKEYYVRLKGSSSCVWASIDKLESSMDRVREFERKRQSELEAHNAVEASPRSTFSAMTAHALIAKLSKNAHMTSKQDPELLEEVVKERDPPTLPPWVEWPDEPQALAIASGL